jgi:RNA chaperone Hfq
MMAKKSGGYGPMKIIEQELTKFGTRLRKVEDQVSALRDMTWVAADLLNELGGKKVKIHIQGGTPVKGVLESYDRFNIRVKADKGRNLVIMKHAITMIEPT